MTGRRWVVAIVGGLTVVVVALAAIRLSPIALWRAPSDGATPLALRTEAPHLVPTMGCDTALLAPVRVTTSGAQLTVVSVGSGRLAQVVWPSGWSAWRVGGQAVLVASDGSVVAREGDVIQDRFAGGLGVDDAFHVCVIGG